MSDTPRTDAEEDAIFGCSTMTQQERQMASFARQLERELNAANERTDMLIDHPTRREV